MISIKGINKLDLLKEFWRHQKAPGFYPSVWSDEIGKKDLENSFIDYCCGKAIKMDLSGDEVNARLYDRDAGEGKALEIINGFKTGLIYKEENEPLEDCPATKNPVLHIKSIYPTKLLCWGCHQNVNEYKLLFGVKEVCNSCFNIFKNDEAMKAVLLNK